MLTMERYNEVGGVLPSSVHQIHIHLILFYDPWEQNLESGFSSLSSPSSATVDWTKLVLQRKTSFETIAAKSQ